MPQATVIHGLRPNCFVPYEQLDMTHATATVVRASIRRGELTGSTAGLAAGFVQANVVMLPGNFADEFAEFAGRTIGLAL